VNRHLSRCAVGAVLIVFIGGLTSASNGQQVSPRHIGVVFVTASPEDKEQFRQGLREAGYVEGRDVIIDWRSTGGDYRRLPLLVSDLVESKIDVIVVATTPAAHAAKQATSTVPIVLATAGDPVESGIVASLARPGGNITGISAMLSDVAAKRLELLKEMLPRVTRVAVLWDPSVSWHKLALANLKTTAGYISIELTALHPSRPDEFGQAFSAIRKTRAKAIYVLDSAFFVAERAALLKFSSEARLPLICNNKICVHEGALMSYAPDYGEMWHRSADYVDKILKGAKPGDLPIGQPTKFELIVNSKTAKALGITIPESILLRADEVIR
jgi:putative ABC transport system substrate-binding protein